MGYDNNDYVQVNERIVKFMEQFPEGSLQSEVVELTDSRVTVKGYAYRTPDDPRPGTGLSFMSIPGATNFTRGSEIENTETSAWGRALAALGFEVKKSIASAEEVANKSADGGSAAGGNTGTTDAPEGEGDAPSGASGLTERQKKLLMARMTEAGLEGRQRNGVLLRVIGVGKSAQIKDSEQLDRVLNALKDEALVASVKAEFEA